MNQVLSLEPSQTPVLAKNKMVAKAMSAETEGKEASEKSDFLTMILSQLNSKIAQGEETTELTLDLDDIDAMIKLTPTLSEEVESLTIERATFTQLLQLVEALSGKNETPKFPVFTEKLDLLLKDAAVLKEFKDVKSLKDLIKLGEKYDLGLEKLTITTKEINTLEKSFPKLAEKEFFQPKKAIISSESILNTKKPESSMAMAKKEEQTPLKDLIKSIAPLKTEAKAEIKEIKADVKEIKAEAKAEIKEIKADIKDLTAKAPLDKPTDTKQVATKVTSEDKEPKTIKVGEQISETASKETKTESPKTTPAATSTTASKFNQSSIFEQTLQSMKPQKQADTPQMAKEIVTKVTESAVENELGAHENDNDAETKNENRQSTLAREIAKTATNQPKATIVKQTLSHFAQDFKEQVENYKPPMMKLQMALNPKNLGEVEVTLVNRGNSLHVNFTSTNQTMNIFVQNQAEFKNSLVNMGFTNLEMNFSDQRDNKDQQGGGRHLSHQFDDENVDEFSHEMTSIEMVIPDYA